MLKVLLAFLLLFVFSGVYAQVKRSVHITVLNEKKAALPGATIYLLTADTVIIRTAAADATGKIEFKDIDRGKYRVKASALNHEAGFSDLIDLETNISVSDSIILQSKTSLLNDVTVVSKKPFVQFLADKTVINPEANITNAGATVMDVLEKSPGITVGKDGSIIMKGKPAVTVFIDGKPTQLSGTELQAYLSGMSASQVDAIELIQNPGAKYDAAGNAGIINIKTKANKQRGFNGSLNISYGQGVYAKTGNTINLNYQEGKINWFMNYGIRANTDFQDIWTLRTYFNSKREDSALLEQPNFGKSRATNQNLKTGVDFFVSNRTTLSLVFNGSIFNRQGNFHS
ncbi:MAG TPA: carboxypeptidase regulatory-like domain-containing protein, partial [Segetibacter sp.]